MIVDKILNNNMVFSKNSQGKEVILKGKGIGFKKKPGDLVDSSQLERIFIPGDNLASKDNTVLCLFCSRDISGKEHGAA